MSYDPDTYGIIFADPQTGDFPTVTQITRSNYINVLGADMSDLEGWHAVAYDPTTLRYYEDDVEAMDETNWEAILDAPAPFGGEIPRASFDYRYDPAEGWANWQWYGLNDVISARVGILSGVSGQILVIAPLPDPDDKSEDADDLRNLWQHFEDCSRALADYPILDESAYSEREWEAWQNYAPDALRQEIIGSDFGKLDLSDDEREAIELASEGDNDLLSILEPDLDYNNGFSGEYGPTFAEVFASLYFGPIAEVDQYRREDAAKLRTLVYSHLPENYCRQCGKSLEDCLPTCERKTANNLPLF